MRVNRYAVLSLAVCLSTSFAFCHGAGNESRFSHYTLASDTEEEASEQPAQPQSNTNDADEDVYLDDTMTPPIVPLIPQDKQDSNTTKFVTGAFVVISALLFLAGYAATKTGEGRHAPSSSS